MIADWIALGNKYGTSGAAFAGNTTWGFNTNIGSTVFANLAAFGDDTAFTIFDASGTDTVDFSGYAANQRINLNPETVSNVGGRIGNMSIARGTWIENATTGAGHDGRPMMPTPAWPLAGGDAAATPSKASRAASAAAWRRRDRKGKWFMRASGIRCGCRSATVARIAFSLIAARFAFP